MTGYNTNGFTPGRKSNLRLFINQAYIQQFYRTNQTFENINYADKTFCGCQPQANKTKQGWNDPSQTENKRISQILTGTLGGKITFGNFYKPVTINYLGGWEGQPGGLPRPLRNRF